MFYGLGDRIGDDNMRDRLSSRDGSAMSGTIWFEHEGKTFELNRQFGNTKAQDIVELLDLEINKRVELDNPEQVGAEVFGLEREIFQNTVFIESEKLESMSPTLVINSRYVMMHLPVREIVDDVRNKIIEICPDFNEIIETTAGCTITTHCGPNTLGILFVRK